MKTETNFPTRRGNLFSLIPIDLRTWMPASELATAAREAAQTFYWIEADDQEQWPFGGCACPLRKLAALSYSYASGMLADDLITVEMVEDPTLRNLSGDAVFTPDKLRLFRAHNSELIKLCLTRVIEQAWTHKVGVAAGKRTFFAEEAGRRVELASRTERPAAIATLDEQMDQGSPARMTPVLPPSILPRFAAAACVLMAVFLWAFNMSAAEVLPEVSFGGRVSGRATVHQSTPADVVVQDGGQGFVRGPLGEMPDELQAVFPRDASASATCDLVLAASHFDNPLVALDGWQGINNDGRREILERLEHPDGSGGYIQLREDDGDSATMQFLAPAKFLGDQRLAYGGRLTFRLKQLRTDQFYSGPDVTFESGGVRLNYFFGRFPGTAWEGFEIPLVEGPRWNRNGQPASAADFRLVLGSLQRLIIRGEFSTRQKERTGLDDIRLLAARPRLEMAHLHDRRIVISWPRAYRGWRLVTSARPASEWTALDASPVEIEDTLSITLPATEAAAFYRLTCPTVP